MYTYADVGAPIWKPEEFVCPALSGQGLSLNRPTEPQVPVPTSSGAPGMK